MRYIIISFFLFSASFTLLSAANDAEAYSGNSAPLPVTIPDSISFSALNSQTEFIEKDSFQVVEDTILPPCDIIFFKSGKIDYCKVVEVTPTSITYKMCDYVDGPSIVVAKSTVQKIRYANGKEEIITVDQSTITQQPTQELATKNNYVKPRKDRLANLAFIFGLTSAGVALLVGIVLVPLALAGLILGIISLIKMSKRKGEFSGKGAAIIGLILCALVLLLIV